MTEAAPRRCLSAEGLFDLDADAPPELNVAIRRSLVRELERRLDAAALDQRPDDTVHDVLSLRELAIRAPDRAEAEAIVDEALARLIRLHDPGAPDAEPHTIGLFSFRPRARNDRTDAGSSERPSLERGVPREARSRHLLHR